MLDTREIHPLTGFLRNHKAHVTRLKETQAPEVLTVNGKAEVVVQDAASYQLTGKTGKTGDAHHVFRFRNHATSPRDGASEVSVCSLRSVFARAASFQGR
jgi:hypothetical protein